jgi:hypothetical protein
MNQPKQSAMSSSRLPVRLFSKKSLMKPTN